jgi:hypothetical protein
VEFARTERCNTAAELQDIFNRRFAPLLASGELQKRERSSKPCRTATMPAGTLTKIYDIFDLEGVHLAVVHAYEEPRTGRILGSGLLDPKAVLIDDVMYFWTAPDRPYNGIFERL